jgi:hypothetical protein
MHRTHSCLKTTQPEPSVEALPHNAGEVSNILSTTSKLRRVGQRGGFGGSLVLSLGRARVPSERTWRLLCFHVFTPGRGRSHEYTGSSLQFLSKGRTASIGAILGCMDQRDLTQHERDRLALLGVLEAVERLGTVVKRPAKVIPFPKPQPKP